MKTLILTILLAIPGMVMGQVHVKGPIYRNTDKELKTLSEWFNYERYDDSVTISFRKKSIKWLNDTTAVIYANPIKKNLDPLGVIFYKGNKAYLLNCYKCDTVWVAKYDIKK
ncbi:MAG: hypothetical protein ABIN91_11165 [Mucilaginibacter sp.]|uniref:hypothetical protein n=1 Tax=Mucilaginibacter sp. TaxID=1882438 RepID=UPI00326718F6